MASARLFDHSNRDAFRILDEGFEIAEMGTQTGIPVSVFSEDVSPGNHTTPGCGLGLDTSGQPRVFETHTFLS